MTPGKVLPGLYSFNGIFLILWIVKGGCIRREPNWLGYVIESSLLDAFVQVSRLILCKRGRLFQVKMGRLFDQTFQQLFEYEKGYRDSPSLYPDFS